MGIMGIKINKMRFAVIALLGFLVTTEAIKLTKEEEEEEDHSKEVFEAREIGTGPLDKKYERVPPEHFTAGSDDLFMKSMIMTYAVEHKNKAASSEVLETHKSLKGSALSDYLGTYFKRTWDHFDVNKDGELGVESMPAFMRFLASDQTLNLQ